MPALKYSLYDCFADVAFQGHTVAVVEVAKKLDHQIAIKVSSELCQNVTCFVWEDHGEIWVEALAKDGSIWPINHGLLGIAKQFFEKDGKGLVHTSVSSFKVKVKPGGVTIILPKLSLAETDIPERLNQAFDITPISVRETGKTCIVELRTVDDLIRIDPDYNRISKLDYDRVVLTAEDDTLPYDYVCRYFSPKHSIDENNGSLYIQTFLPLFWQERLRKDTFKFLQLSSTKAVGNVAIKGDSIYVEAPVHKTFEGELKIL